MPKPSPSPKPIPNPTTKTYTSLDDAFAFFNARLFAGRLPACLITMQRSKSAYGYFAGGRFGSKDGKEVTDEIALNPSHFRDRSTEQSLSTLVHEMTHLEQHHFGKPSRAGYHNKQWAGMMKAVGLVPSDTGAPGGKEVGQKVTHYIEAGGPFETRVRRAGEEGLQSALRGALDGGRREDAQEEGREQDALHMPAMPDERMGEAGRETDLRRMRRAHACRG